MADWKQITARIRRARTGKDPAAQLSNLFQKTRDAMVAFELAKFLETSGQSSEAAKWYATAAERFRRQDWKTKAQEAVTRLGNPVSSDNNPVSRDNVADETPPPVIAVPDAAVPFEQTATSFQSTIDAVPQAAEASEDTSRAPGQRQSRRRGGRGGRNRRRGRGGSDGQDLTSRRATTTTVTEAPPPVDEVPESRFSRVTESITPRAPESVAEPVASSPRARYGDPGLSSRLTLLEMQFRRLLNCAPMRLSDGSHAPAGPGVILLSDSELTTNYYVEACQTLRVAISALSRGSGSGRGTESIKPALAEHLGIAETKVTKYLAEHCVVRYLQLDQDATHFAHFVIAVLRPALNE